MCKREEISAERREALFIIFGGRCVFCNSLLLRNLSTVDHFMPLFAGGCNHDHNLLLSCTRCNEDKADEDPIDYLIKIGKIKTPEFSTAIKALDTCTQMDKEIKKFKARQQPRGNRRRYSQKDFGTDRWAENKQVVQD